MRIFQWRIFKWLFRILQFIGTVLDIRDIAGLIRRSGQASGTALIVVAGINWIDDNVPALTLVFFGLGAFILLLVALPDLWTWLPRRRSQLVQEPEDEHPVAVSDFAPYRHMLSKIMRVDMAGLWAEHDHYIDFIVYMKQTIGWQVTLDDVKGRALIGRNQCALSAYLLNGPRKLTDPTGFYDCTIRQPLTQEMASALVFNPGAMNLFDKDARVQVSLAGLKWIGTVALPQGNDTLADRVVCEETFTILGPVRERDADKVLIRGGVFLSSQVYRHHDSGLLREPSTP